MKIYVKEMNAIGKTTAEGTMDEKEYERLYGKYDLDWLIKNGENGDAIGQGRYFYSKIVEYDGDAF